VLDPRCRGARFRSTHCRSTCRKDASANPSHQPHAQLSIGTVTDS
jgi:hypothetical protein